MNSIFLAQAPRRAVRARISIKVDGIPAGSRWLPRLTAALALVFLVLVCSG